MCTVTKAVFDLLTRMTQAAVGRQERDPSITQVGQEYTPHFAGSNRVSQRRLCCHMEFSSEKLGSEGSHCVHVFLF